ncbi:hypothetical protein FB565_004297 [Actinoplanes lutulentus]|uniref:Uncharacterized protein DUF2071 n=1 Tax=Actinoplanes lutulentus TaxID=1287878 RepID=A0A327ZHN5_9ACTN|nr:DUF2071 domain-containing protein [Actinoplanes lutulentus]MBB2944568.1 hypothetical protein [Actinoplanes lutulentus]RAK42203.1 uncharacterized protein DUF2071 [Actinoplanes lutulentus]
MRAPRLVSVVQRRLLVNYRTDPEVTARLLPAPLRPQVVDGWAVSGICLIRLSMLAGLRSENGAHRIAVEWDTPDGVAYGVYIPRRDTGSRLNAWAGGRVFPGRHHRSRFDVRESADELRIAFGDEVRVDVHARMAADLSASQVFGSVDQASEFFRRGAAGFSDTPDPSRLDGIALTVKDWQVTPVELVSVRSSFFDDPDRFPPGSAVPDCGLLMRDVPAVWNPLPPMTVGPAFTPAR